MVVSGTERRRNVKSLSMLVALFMVISMVAAGLPLTVNATDGTPGEPDAPNAPETYTAHIIYDLKGGAWKDRERIDNYKITKDRGERIPPSEFKGEGIVPVNGGNTFIGWNFRLEGMDGTTIQDGGNALWIFGEHRYNYGTGTPSEFKIIFTAKWEPAEESEKSVLHVSYDLLGGKWNDSEKIADYDIEFEPETDIPASEFKGKDTIPVRDGFVFDGWGWEWTGMEGNVLAGGGDADWIFAFGWPYDEDDPQKSNLKLIANWKPVKTPKEEPTKAEPGKVIPKTPKTGDNSPLALATLLLVGAGTATVGFGRKIYMNK